MSQSRYKAQALIESLEKRQLLSGSVALTPQGVLDVTGTRKNDKIAITVDHHRRGKLDVAINGKTYALPAAAISQIDVEGGAGNDSISVDSLISAPATLNGGDGNDTIIAGGGDDTIDGGTGTDQCDFHHNSGVPLSQVPAAVQTGLTTLAQGATITNVQIFHEAGQTYYGTLVTINNVNTRIVVDANGNPVTTGIDDNHGGGDHHNGSFGSIVRVDPNASTITINITNEHGPGQQKTFTVAANATVTIDGTASSLASLTAGAWVHLQVSSSDPNTVTAIQAFGKRVEGTVASVDAGANTITINTDQNGAATYNVSPTATVTLNGSTSTLSSLLAGTDVRLKFSADNTTVISIFAGDDGGDLGDHGGGDHGGGHDHEGPDF